jgi:hypothetical protein
VLAPAESWGKTLPAHRVEVVDPDVLEREIAHEETGGTVDAPQPGVYRARLELSAAHFRGEPSSTSLTLEIDGQTARVAFRTDAWSSLLDVSLSFVG